MKKLNYIFIIMLICISTAHAQTTNSNPDVKNPNLNGHVFPSLSNFRSSFVTTSLNANLGYGITSPLRIGGITIGDHELYTFEGQIIFLNMGVQYQQRFNPWLAMNITLSMVGRVGADMSTILANGVNTMSGGRIGWLIRIKQSKKFNLSGSVQITNMNGSFINVKEYFEDVVNDVPNPSLVKKVPSMSIGGGLLGAWAISKVFGLQFHGDYAYGESFVRENEGGYYSFGFNADADLNPAQKVPIGFALGYALSSAPEIMMGDSGHANLLTGKIGYTGSDEFELGIQYTYYKINLESVEGSPSVSTFTLLLKFYF